MGNASLDRCCLSARRLSTLELVDPEPCELPGGPDEHEQEQPIQPGGPSVIFKHFDNDVSNILVLNDLIVEDLNLEAI